jgi:hypothetical protein
MTDEAFLRALESCVLPEAAFGHSAHVRAAYLYLLEGDFVGALGRMRGALINFTSHLGKPGRYHETITVAYVALIQQHIYERGNGGGWAAFASENPELFEPGLLQHFYPPQQLESEMARRVFLLPQLASPPAAVCG